MILGVFERDPRARVDEARLRSALAGGGVVDPNVELWTGGPAGLARLSPDAGAGESAPSAHLAYGDELATLVDGVLYGDAERCAELRAPGEAVLAAYRKADEDLGLHLDGRFALAVVDLSRHRMVIARDPMGLSTLYYLSTPERVIFSTSVTPILRYAGRAPELDPEAVTRFLMFNYNPGFQTIHRGVRKLRPGHRLVVDDQKDRLGAYWRLEFLPSSEADEVEVARGIQDRVRHAVRRRMQQGSAPAVFVSGGLDSSTVLGMVREAWDGPIHTYSYRCKSKSFDESMYARRMADFVGSEHHELEYRAEDALLIDDLTATMNEPFCDVGINVATYLLGRAAAGHERLVFTGDGGDELFGGHPIYEADKIARFVDPVPGVVRTPLLKLLTLLPDSDQKKNLTVKLKRFGESAQFPKALLSHRWRLYYQIAELSGVLTPGFADDLDSAALFGDILDINAEAPARLDMLGRSLYSDYATICDFYLRRNDLFAPFGIETRYPLFDRELVEYCAKVPSSMKIKGWFEAKHIFKKAIEDVIPRDIVYREDKLGHSIPLKNWLRDDPQVRSFVLDLVSPEAVKRRGVVRPEFVARLISDHMSMRTNNSHRLWTLAVLELWCRHHIDGGVPA